MYDQMSTMTGMTLAQATAKLDEELPKEAYSAVPGGANLTDIDPNWMRRILNFIFGLCGIGWGYVYNSADLTVEIQERSGSSGKRLVFLATLKRLTFWFSLQLPDGSTIRCEIPASGGSENSVEAYAMKGAITNALGNAVSNIGFQESVYLGVRSHKTVASGKPATAKPVQAAGNGAAARKSTPAVPAASNSAPAPKAPTSKPVPIPTSRVSSEDPATYIIPVGSRAGKTLSQVWTSDPNAEAAISFYAGMATGGDQQKELLKKMAASFLNRVKANGSASVAA